MDKLEPPMDEQLAYAKRYFVRTVEVSTEALAALARSLAAKNEALREAERLVVKYAEFFCEDDFDPLIDGIRAALNITAQQKGGDRG